MAMRSALVRSPRPPLSIFAMDPATLRGNFWCSSDSTGRVLREEERAIENVYIQKMERERLEKLRKKAEKERFQAGKAKLTEKKPQEAHTS